MRLDKYVYQAALYLIISKISLLMFLEIESNYTKTLIKNRLNPLKYKPISTPKKDLVLYP